jgi:hypothetical protein
MDLFFLGMDFSASITESDLLLSSGLKRLLLQLLNLLLNVRHLQINVHERQ